MNCKDVTAGMAVKFKDHAVEGTGFAVGLVADIWGRISGNLWSVSMAKISRPEEQYVTEGVIYHNDHSGKEQHIRGRYRTFTCSELEAI